MTDEVTPVPETPPLLAALTAFAQALINRNNEEDVASATAALHEALATPHA